jgi:hypothetical protein
MKESVQQTSNGSRCRGTNRRGERCQRLASEPGGLCIVHAGKQSMAELGRKGGRSKETALRKEVRVDDELREQAREVLAKALRGENVDREQLAAARSLFSYRPDAPQAPQREQQGSSGRMVFGLEDLVATACELKMLSQTGILDADTESRLFERLRGERDEGKPASEVDDAAYIAHPPPS